MQPRQFSDEPTSPWISSRGLPVPAWRAYIRAPDTSTNSSSIPCCAVLVALRSHSLLRPPLGMDGRANSPSSVLTEPQRAPDVAEDVAEVRCYSRVNCE